jgi:hypothetical protein
VKIWYKMSSPWMSTKICGTFEYATQMENQRMAIASKDIRKYKYCFTRGLELSSTKPMQVFEMKFSEANKQDLVAYDGQISALRQVVTHQSILCVCMYVYVCVCACVCVCVPLSVRVYACICLL